MSYLYKYKFVSPEPNYALIKEELKSYFDTQAVDDVMFPIWTRRCLNKFGKMSYEIGDGVLFIDSFQARLPPDFYAVREAWFTGTGYSPSFRKPGAFYEQITTVLNKPYDACNPENNCDPCNPDVVRVVTKTTTEESYSFPLKHLLKPGNISVRDHCDTGCLNYSSTSEDTFDIKDGKFVTNFREGDVYLVYYKTQSDENGNMLIPENERIQSYVEAHIKMKIFEQLSNQATDETFNQMQAKLAYYTQQAKEAFIMADIESKKKDMYGRAYAIKKDNHRLDKYNAGIYTGSYRRR